MSSFAFWRFPHLFSLWADWLATGQGQQLDRWLRNWFSTRKAYGKKDRMAYAQEIFSAMRVLQLANALELSYRKGEQDWAAFDANWHSDDAAKVPPAAFWYWVMLRYDADAQPSKDLHDAAERLAHFKQCARSWGQLDKLQAENLIWFGIRPQWLADLQQRAEVSGWDKSTLCRFIEQQISQPPVWLRCQQGATAQSIFPVLQQQGLNVSLENNMLAVRGGTGILETQAFKDGLIEIQDAASQQISAAVQVQPGQKVWDTCAGGGGKSLAIASRMAGKGVLVATDIREYKLNEVKKRAKRAGYFHIRTFAWDASAPLQLPREVAQQNGFDWTLIDAPCSSAGTWRRNPDARWWLNADLSELLALQSKIMQQAAPAVRAGGHLVYATCSWKVEENEQRVQLFLQQNSDFTLVSQNMLGCPSVDADAMFVAVMQKKANS